MRVPGQKSWAITLFLCLVFVLHVAAEETIESDVDAVCVNDNTPRNITWGGELVGVTCGCDKQGTYGTKCDKCLFEQQGTWSAIKSWTGHKVMIWVTTIDVTGIVLAVAIIGLTLYHHFQLQPYGGSSFMANVSTVGAISDLEKVAASSDSDKVRRAAELPVASNNESLAKRLNYNPSRYMDEWAIVIIMFITGMVVYTTFVSTPKIFHDKTKSWPWFYLPDYKTCSNFGGGIFAGLMLMVGAAMFWTAHLYSISSVASRVKRAAEAEKSHDQEAWLSWFNIGRREGSSLLKLGFLIGTFTLIIIRVFLSDSEDSRSCCNRRITATSVDFGFNIILVVCLGSTFFCLLYWIMRHLWIGSNVTGHQAAWDHFDQATVDVVNIHMCADARPWYGNPGVFAVHFCMVLLLAYGAVLLSLDLANSSAHEPMLKGYITFVVLLTVFLYYTIAYFMNQRNAVEKLFPQQARNNNWGRFLETMSVKKDPSMTKESQRQHFTRVYVNCPPCRWGPECRSLPVGDAYCMRAHINKFETQCKQDYPPECCY
jgi:hypothetical protein